MSDREFSKEEIIEISRDAGIRSDVHGNYFACSLKELMNFAKSISEIKFSFPDCDMEYTKRGSAEEKYYRCKIIAIDGGDPIIKTRSGRYHRRPVSKYIFRRAE